MSSPWYTDGPVSTSIPLFWRLSGSLLNQIGIGLADFLLNRDRIGRKVNRSFSKAHDSTLCLKKVPIFKLSVTLSNLNQFSKFLHCWKAYEICYKTHLNYLPHLRHVATLL